MRTRCSAPAAAVAALLFLPIAGAGQEPPPADARSWSGASLRPGDMVRLLIWRDPELNGEYPIDESGSVTLPLIGPRVAVGLPADQFRQLVVDDLSGELRNQDPVVTLLRRVRVLGEVQMPGLYHIDPTMTLGDVIALAQGSTPEGRLNGIRIVRDGTEIRSDLDTTIPVVQAVMSGDQIMVPKNSWIARNGRWLAGGMLSMAGIITAALIR
ncbi:MAG: polysaccharide biosynthesis/export family protein [Gemmatimonadota bacterium]|nr:polysaccharide biosynthesis/export family protein [Gemmatimonadota bacterium]